MRLLKCLTMKPAFWFLAPAVGLFLALFVLPISLTLVASVGFCSNGCTNSLDLSTYEQLFFDPKWRSSFVNALKNTITFFLFHMAIQNVLALIAAVFLSSKNLKLRGFFMSLIFFPALLSFVVVGFIWQLLLSPDWGVSKQLLDFFGLGEFARPWLGLEGSSLVTVSVISVWQFLGIPTLFVYTALRNIPQDILDAASVDGVSKWTEFSRVQLPLIFPTIMLVSILTFVGTFSAFDLVYTMQGALAGPNYSTDILGTYFYRTFFGFQLQQGDPQMGATIAVAILSMLLIGIAAYLFYSQRFLLLGRSPGNSI